MNSQSDNTHQPLDEVEMRAAIRAVNIGNIDADGSTDTDRLYRLFQSQLAAAFNSYTLIANPHRVIFDENIVSKRGRVIRFGQTKPKYPYLHILFDQKNKRLAFAPGDKFDGISYKVNQNPASKSWSITARPFEGVLPDGLYRKDGDVFTLQSQADTNQNHEGGDVDG